MHCNVISVGIVFSAGAAYSIWLIVAASFLATHPSCEDPYPSYQLAMGVCILVVSFMGFISVICQNRILHGLYLISVSAFLITTLFMTGFLAVGTSYSQEEKNTGTAYHLDVYSPWLKSKLVNQERMATFRKCMVEKNVCRYHLDADRTWKQPIEVGCCNPPTVCGLVKKNATRWEKPKKGVDMSQINEMDCVRWDNHGLEFCLACESCKAGFLAAVLRLWHSRDLVCFVYSIVMMGSFAFAIHHREH